MTEHEPPDSTYPFKIEALIARFKIGEAAAKRKQRA